MKNRTILTLLYLLAILLLFAFSFLPSGFRTYGSALALFIPLAIGISVFVKKNGTKIPMYEGKKDYLLPSLFFAPTLLTVISISMVTAIILSMLGLENPPLDDIPLLDAILAYAVLPAILEESLYRILPSLALADEDMQSICLYSSLVFGFAHMSLFSIPYAFFSGLAFFCINRLARSPLPSILLHLINNLLSIWFTYARKGDLVFSYMVEVLTVLSVASVLLMLLFYKSRLIKLAERLRDRGVSFRISLDLIAYLVLTSVLAVIFI